MKYIAINTIGDYPEDFLFAKVDVEHHLQETGQIENRMRLDEFIIWLNLQKTIYLKSQHSIAFRIAEGEKENYVFYSLLDQDDKLFEAFKHKLETLKFDFSTLKKIAPVDLMSMDLDTAELFMIDSEMYV